jgi:hypothetical protein
VVLRHKLNEKIIHGENGIRKMETETGFRFGTRHPQESINESLSGKWKRKPVSVSEPDIPESQSMRVCLWSIVVNSENSDPAKNKRAYLPAAGKFARGQKKKIPTQFWGWLDTMVVCSILRFQLLCEILKRRKRWREASAQATRRGMGEQKKHEANKDITSIDL